MEVYHRDGYSRSACSNRKASVSALVGAAHVRKTQDNARQALYRPHRRYAGGVEEALWT